MKTERQIAEQIFQLFRNTNCKDNEGFMINSLNAQVVFKLDPKERELFDTVYVGLQALQYIEVDDDGFIRLTKKGYDYIYDDELVEKMQVVPWIIPGYKNTNWIAAWNKLWKTIGEVPTESQYYYSGPKFLNTICEVDNSIETDYSKFIEYRNKKELPTSRKNYFRDLIDGLEVEKRYEFYVMIQLALEDSILAPIFSTKDKLEQPTPKTVIGEPIITEVKAISAENHPTVFISYSWDSVEHKKWVKKLADDLKLNGIDVIIDQYEPAGIPLTAFMMDGINKADRVLIVGTPNYKIKAETHKGGTNVEDQIINIHISRDFNKPKFIPILRTGSFKDSFTDLVGDRKGFDFSDDSCYAEGLNQLSQELLGKTTPTL